MIIKIIKSKGFEHCEGVNCKKLPQYISKRGKIKNKALMIALYSDQLRYDQDLQYGDAISADYVYCDDCADELYNEVRMKLNRDLWIFQ